MEYDSKFRHTQFQKTPTPSFFLKEALNADSIIMPQTTGEYGFLYPVAIPNFQDVRGMFRKNQLKHSPPSPNQKSHPTFAKPSKDSRKLLEHLNQT
ncbi:hypothetical protein AVEN_264854-1 [Araneus ventricosus]|uniref:Uncharacterized protein n=1 Tax=Araneus ventricosus TaxID=182803 RepID=A0A4Y2L1U4_ARAVE|nr:hypothetical protein AVEN_264854-1 [Araneus ventricosus]